MSRAIEGLRALLRAWLRVPEDVIVIVVSGVAGDAEIGRAMHEALEKRRQELN